MIAHSIRRSRPSDAEEFPALENSAGQAFRRIPHLAWIADLEDLPTEAYLQSISEGTSWAALDHRGRPIGFLSAESRLGKLHIQELSVRLDCQRRGIGRELVLHVISEVKRRHLTALTLTTFRDVPWNAPLYARQGFRILGRRELDPDLVGILLSDAERGLPARLRCAMRLRIREGRDT